MVVEKNIFYTFDEKEGKKNLYKKFDYIWDNRYETGICSVYCFSRDDFVNLLEEWNRKGSLTKYTNANIWNYREKI